MSPKILRREITLFLVLFLQYIYAKEIFISNESPFDGNGTQINPYNTLINGFNNSKNEKNLTIMIISNLNEYKIDETFEIISVDLKIISLSNYAILKFQKKGYFYMDGNTSLVFENISFKTDENFSLAMTFFINNCFCLVFNVKSAYLSFK